MQSATTLGLTVQLPKFEGPLPLLLYLIRKEEMDIMDIRINEITGQYLEYIKLMKELDLELAGEFVAMAATLIHIKSRMLLPSYNENGEVVENDDPRKELVQRLLEYQKYQEAAQQLYERPLLGRDIWPRGIREKLEAKDDEILLEDNALFSLISAFRGVVKGAKKKVHQVSTKLQSIASRIVEIKSSLVLNQRVPMSELIHATEKRHLQVLITFLSVLELGKMGFVRLFQSDVYQEIYIEAHREIEDAALSRVEEYDNVHASETADALAIKMANDPVTDFEDFVLADSSLSELEESPEMTFGFTAEQDIASDDEIFAAEQELSDIADPATPSETEA